jgi:hypothetical protein
MSLGVSSAFVAFMATFGTLYFRQEAFMHAKNLKQIEVQCAKLKNENLILSARIAQAQAPYQLKEKPSNWRCRYRESKFYTCKVGTNTKSSSCCVIHWP